MWNGAEVKDGLVVQMGHVGDAVRDQLQSVGDEFVQAVHSLCTILHLCQVINLVPVLTPNLRQRERKYSACVPFQPLFLRRTATVW